jgi:hypothetical protein
VRNDKKGRDLDSMVFWSGARGRKTKRGLGSVLWPSPLELRNTYPHEYSIGFMDLIQEETEQQTAGCAKKATREKIDQYPVDKECQEVLFF